MWVCTHDYNHLRIFISVVLPNPLGADYPEWGVIIHGLTEKARP
jgi:hypothetical protein